MFWFYEFENMASLESGILIRSIIKKIEFLKELKPVLNSRFTDFQALSLQIWVGFTLKIGMVKRATELNKFLLLLYISKPP